MASVAISGESRKPPSVTMPATPRFMRRVARMPPAEIRYRSTRSPAEIEQFLASLLLHFFNHQTHHRGQAHCLLTGIAGEVPSFDLLVFQRATGVSLVKGQGGCFTPPERRRTTST